MGLISKIKNILFEEEEVELPINNKTIEKREQVEEKPYKEVEENRVESYYPENSMDNLSDRETFKSDLTFNFPAFDEEEFESTLPKPRSTNVIIQEKKKKIEIKPDFKRYNTEHKESDSRGPKKFKPSPIISPVYGILDKDYTPEDVKSKEKKDDINRLTNVDLDRVRKKAFGELEEEIDKTLNETLEDFYTERKENLNLESTPVSKSIDELLEESAQEEIIIPREKERENNIKDIEAELDKLDNDEVEILTEERKESSADDTLEQDLFELIDSMYDKKEDEE